MLTSKGREELLSLVADNVPNLEGEIAAFNELRTTIQGITAQTVSSELKSLVEAGKVYEKHLKNVDKQIREAAIASHAQVFEKLQDIKDNLFSLNNIQERKVDSLEMLIKYRDVVFSVKNSVKLNNSLGHVISL
jgi:DNA-binding HxlR family transcriptional regulator